MYLLIVLLSPCTVPMEWNTKVSEVELQQEEPERHICTVTI